VSFRPENGERGEAPDGPSGGAPDEEFRASREERYDEGRRRRLTGRPGIVPIVVGILLLALLIGGLLLWSFYGDRAGGTSVFEDSIESGPEPVVRLTNGPGRVRVEGVDSGEEASEVTSDARAASDLGVSGTPTFFINGIPLVGAQPISEFSRVIDAELGS